MTLMPVMGPLICLLVLSVCIFQTVLGTPPVNSIPVKVVNHAGAPIQVFWVDVTDGNLVPQTTKPLRNGTEANINSYNGHQFVAKFLDNIEGAEAYFTKGPNEERVLITYDVSFNTMVAKQITKFDEIMDLINEATTTCDSVNDQAFTDCIGEKVLEEVSRLKETTKEIVRFRDLIAPRLYDYICADNNPNASEVLRSRSFDDRNQKYIADVLVDTSNAKVWTVENAISESECKLLNEKSVTAPSSGPATVDTTENSNPALQPYIVPQRRYELTKEHPEKDPLWPLFSKIYKITNFVSKHALSFIPDGQEGFSVTSFSSGEGVRPHCAGACGPEPYKSGDRMASAVLFCEVADEGGTLMFPKSDVVIRPKKGMGVFFTYKQTNGTDMDDGYTEHSLCPVRGGKQSVVSLHMRDGVAQVRPPVIHLPKASVKSEL